MLCYYHIYCPPYPSSPTPLSRSRYLLSVFCGHRHVQLSSEESGIVLPLVLLSALNTEASIAAQRAMPIRIWLTGSRGRARRAASPARRGVRHRPCISASTRGRALMLIRRVVTSRCSCYWLAPCCAPRALAPLSARKSAKEMHEGMQLCILRRVQCVQARSYARHICRPGPITILQPTRPGGRGPDC